MKVLLQRVKESSVCIDGQCVSKIGAGIMALVGIEKDDTSETIEKMAKKTVNLRIFSDENGKMNKSLLDVNGEMLIVSQFTLCGNCKKGTRPSFDNSAPPELAEELYNKFIKAIKEYGVVVKTGRFGAMMEVSLINDGPVTFMLEFN